MFYFHWTVIKFATVLTLQQACLASLPLPWQPMDFVLDLKQNIMLKTTQPMHLRNRTII